MLFSYTQIKNNQKIKSKIEATDLIDAKNKLKLNNIIYSGLKRDILNINISYSKKINLIELANISRDLSIYLDSGVPLVGTIKLISQNYSHNKKTKVFFDSVYTFLDEGKSFFMALSLQKVYKIPNFYLQSIKISEDRGTIKSVLIELSKYIKEQQKVIKQITSAMIYPMFILLVAFAVILYILINIVPKITSMFDKLHQELPTITKVVIKLGDFFQNYWVSIVILLMVTVTIFIFLYQKYFKFRYKIDTLLLKIPIIGSLISSSELGRFSYMVSVLGKSGMPLVQSVKLASAIFKNSVYISIFNIASKKIVEGERFSTSLASSSGTLKIDRVFLQSIAIGEETNQLSSMLDSLSELYGEKNREKIDIFLSLIEPVLMLVVGVIIGTIVLAMLLPIFSISVN
jgi:general secretion pathway protein F/type IV pilus assembly protein PilC